VLTAAAHVLMQEMRIHLAPTRWAQAQISTLREPFLKELRSFVSLRRIVLHLPRSFPDRNSFAHLVPSVCAHRLAEFQDDHLRTLNYSSPLVAGFLPLPSLRPELAP